MKISGPPMCVWCHTRPQHTISLCVTCKALWDATAPPARHGNPWTAREDGILLDSMDRRRERPFTWAELARRMKRPRRGVEKRARYLRSIRRPQR